MHDELIDQYEQGGEKLRSAIRGLSSADLKWQPPADAGVGAWSIHEVIIHLQDSDTIGADRMKRIAAEENPLIVGYNENLFAKKLSYHEQSIEDAIALVDVTRRQLIRILRRLPSEAFSRTGIHTESGKITLESELKKYIWHLDHHLGFVAKKRAKLGK